MGVVPTYVGVFRRHRRINRANGGCPHIRGGVPLRLIRKGGIDPLSPHTWGCSATFPCPFGYTRVVPTYVGVFRAKTPARLNGWSCPHIRGGVPGSARSCRPAFWLSPHTWGCSGAGFLFARVQFVVPTYVGVFLTRCEVRDERRSCPHIRGGVPIYVSSALQSLLVVPTYVGVFRLKSALRSGNGSLSPHTWGCSSTRPPVKAAGACCPHIRGGVPNQ